MHSGTAPMTAVTAMDGTVLDATTTARMSTPPALVMPAARPAPRERTAVG